MVYIHVRHPGAEARAIALSCAIVMSAIRGFHLYRWLRRAIALSCAIVMSAIRGFHLYRWLRRAIALSCAIVDARSAPDRVRDMDAPNQSSRRFMNSAG